MNLWQLSRQILLLITSVVIVSFLFWVGVFVGYAEETATPSPTAVSTTNLLITGVQPTTVLNSFVTELALTGGGFADGAIVLLDGYGGLETKFVSHHLLTAILPSGLPEGMYSVRVVNPDATTALLSNVLTIRAVTETATSVPTTTPLPTAFVRPQMVVQSYGASSVTISPNSNLAFEMTVINSGQIDAHNVTVSFKTGDFVPRETGGVQAFGIIGTGHTHRFWQPLYANSSLSGQTIATLEVLVNYTDANGTDYNDTFQLTFPVVPLVTGSIATATPTLTPTPTATPTTGPRLHPQLLITQYETDIDQLVPGTQFRLNLVVENQGNANAERVTMIIGGGTASSGSVSGTPEAGGGGGLSGAGGEFSKFAPVGSSNVQFIGDVAQGTTYTVGKDLIVNATAEAGAYPIRISFVYNDSNGTQMVDDQVITLLVYRRPQVTINFYNPPPTVVAGELSSLPLQVLNGGRGAVSLQTFKATAVGATLTNNEIFVGNLDTNGFFPVDVQILPDVSGLIDLVLTVDYLDDFGQLQTITQTISIPVEENFTSSYPDDDWGDSSLPDGEDWETEILTEESWGEWFWRLLLGLIGLSSSRSTDIPMSTDMPPVP